MTNSRVLAEFAGGLRFADLPNEVVEKAKGLVLNTIAAQLAASTTPWLKLIYRYARGQGGVPESTIVNYGLRTSSANAAFVNGCFAHGVELDDNHHRTHLKGGSVAVPTALAVGEQLLSSGRELIAAIVAGYEVMTRAAAATHHSLRTRGNHPTGTCGALGAATIASRLLGLNQDAFVHAIGLAASHAVGYAETTEGRGQVKRTFPGAANADGIRSTLLAAAGLTSTETTLDVGFGFCRGFDVDEAGGRTLVAGLGRNWDILDCHYKIYAQDGFIQPMTEALERIRKAHAFATDDIAEVWLGTTRRACEEVVGPIREPTSLADAQFSANFSAALYLVKGGAGFYEYTEENLEDHEVRELSQRVIVGVDEEIEAEFQKSGPRGAKVRVQLKSGEEFHERVFDLRWMPQDELDDKFRTLAATVLEEAQSEKVLETVHHLEELRDVSELTALLVRHR